MIRSGLSKLMKDAYCVQFCLKPFCREVNNLHLPHDKKNSDITIHKWSSHQL